MRFYSPAYGSLKVEESSPQQEEGKIPIRFSFDIYRNSMNVT